MRRTTNEQYNETLYNNTTAVRGSGHEKGDPKHTKHLRADALHRQPEPAHAEYPRA